jgi:WD40 repeat protein
MSVDVGSGRPLDELLADIAPSRAPERLRRDVFTAIDRVQPRPRWLALMKEPPMRLSSRVAVGSPTARLAYLMILTLLVAMLAMGGVVAGASLLPSPAPVPAACTDVVCPVAPLAEGRTGASATRLADGSVLVIGGGTQNWSVFPQTAELWDPATETFRPAGRLAVGRHSHAATLLPDGRILVVGGFAFANRDGVLLDSAEVWDPQTATFSTTGSLALPRAGQADALLPDGRVLVVGGTSEPSDTSEIWDPATGAFSPGPSLSQPRGGATAVRLEDGRVLVIGGTVDYPATAEVFDPASMSFTPTGPLTVRGDFTATLLADGRVLAIGGDGSRRGTAGQTWDPATGVWTATGSPARSYSFSQTETLLADGRVLVVSGPAEIWDPTTNAFGSVGPTLPGLGQQTATLLEDGRVLVVGGFDGTPTALAAAALWDLRGVPSQGATASPAP